MASRCSLAILLQLPEPRQAVPGARVGTNANLKSAMVFWVEQKEVRRHCSRRTRTDLKRGVRSNGERQPQDFPHLAQWALCTKKSCTPALELLAGNANGVERGTVSQAQLDGTKRRVLSWGIDPTKVELTIATKKAPPRAGEV